MSETSGNQSQLAGERSGLAATAASGAMWMAMQSVFSRLYGFLVQIVISWLLMPEQVGQIALVYTITAFATQLINPGVDSVLLQKHTRMQRWVTPAFWLCLTCGAVGALVMVAAGTLTVTVARSFGNEAYGDPTLIRLIAILCIGAPLNTAGLVPMVILNHQMRFARVASVNLLEGMLQQTLTVACAAAGLGVYSFVVPMPIVAAVRTAVLWRIARPRVRLHANFHRWPALISSTGWILGQRLLATATSQGDYIVLALIFASKGLVGQYSFAFLLATQAIRVICDNVGAALTPALNVMQGDRMRLFAGAERAARVLAAIVAPLAMLQFLFAGPAISLIFASKWYPAIPLVRALSVGTVLLTAVWPMGNTIIAQGRFRDGFILWILNALSFFSVVIPCTRIWSALGTAIGVSAWSAIAGCLFSSFVYGREGVRKYASIMAKPLFSVIATSAPLSFIITVMPRSAVMNAVTIAFFAPLAVALYAMILRVLAPETYAFVARHATDSLFPILRRVRRAPLGRGE